MDPGPKEIPLHVFHRLVCVVLPPTSFWLPSCSAPVPPPWCDGMLVALIPSCSSSEESEWMVKWGKEAQALVIRTSAPSSLLAFCSHFYPHGFMIMRSVWIDCRLCGTIERLKVIWWHCNGVAPSR